ncbi:hypothetical protein [Actinomadura alba]|uniref:Uncharacterized protein n=1 Tax=Actinomadura alba TaxID=406431 RepID=A0ABR7M0F8_9ACTN|nr:hypothetical protein [Actinomadura alba]MBC6470599.1 hypothetical protein [Actinomadura alba]
MLPSTTTPGAGSPDGETRTWPRPSTRPPRQGCRACVVKAQRLDLVAEALPHFLSPPSYARVRDEQGRPRIRTLLLAREGETDARHLGPPLKA